MRTEKTKTIAGTPIASAIAVDNNSLNILLDLLILIIVGLAVLTA